MYTPFSPTHTRILKQTHTHTHTQKRIILSTTDAYTNIIKLMCCGIEFVLKIKYPIKSNKSESLGTTSM